MADDTQYEHTGSAQPAVLDGSINDTALSIVCDDLSGWPTGGLAQFWATIDPGTADEERILCDGRTGNTITVATGGRGADDTVAVNHADDAVIVHGFSAFEAQQLSDHISSTSGVHGVVGAVVGRTDAQTLTNKAISGANNTLTAIPQSAVTNLETDLAGRATDAELTSEANARAAADALLQPLSAKNQSNGYAGLSGGLLDDDQVPGRDASIFDSDTSLTSRDLADGDPAKVLGSVTLETGVFLIVATCKGFTLASGTSTRITYDLSASGGTSTLVNAAETLANDTTAQGGGCTVIGFIVVTAGTPVVSFTAEKQGTGALITTSTSGVVMAIKLSDL